MVAIFEKSEQNADFHPIVDFIEASPLRRNLKLQDEEAISSLPDTELFENLTLMGYNISPNQKFTFQKGEACPTDSSFIADQDRATIAKSSTLPRDTAPRVTSPAAIEGKDNQGVIGARSTDDAPIKRRRIDKEEGITRRVSSDTEEIRMDEGEGGIDVPTGSYSIPTVGPPVVDIHTGSDAVPTASPIITTATVRLQEQIDAQVARELDEQQEREDKRMTKQIARDAEVPRIHAEEELQDFIPMGSQEEAERLKRDGFNLEQEKAKKQKTSEEVPDKEKSPEEILEEKVKEMMQLVPIEEVEDLNRLWVLVKEYLSIRPASSDKEIELWVVLKRLYEPDPEDQLWAQTHNYMHAPIECKLYDLSGVHHVTAKDKEIFMLVEKIILSEKV
nr:hypothetical protein [Tanacetum cinerariifolium]